MVSQSLSVKSKPPHTQDNQICLAKSTVLLYLANQEKSLPAEENTPATLDAQTSILSRFAADP